MTDKELLQKIMTAKLKQAYKVLNKTYMDYLSEETETALYGLKKGLERVNLLVNVLEVIKGD